MTQPTKVKNSPWIRAQGPDTRHTEYIGKWMLFVAWGKADQTWEIIKNETERGNLGIASKISTAQSNAPGRSMLICVYTYDARDLDNVRNVLRSLRQIGFTSRLNYKEDNATLALMYGNGASLYTSPYGDIIKTLRPVIEPDEIIIAKENTKNE